MCTWRNYNSSLYIYFCDKTLQIAVSTQSVVLNLGKNFVLFAQKTNGVTYIFRTLLMLLAWGLLTF